MALVLAAFAMVAGACSTGIEVAFEDDDTTAADGDSGDPVMPDDPEQPSATPVLPEPGDEPTPTAEPTEPSEIAAGMLEDTDCRFDEPADAVVACSWLTVPADWADPDGETIRLHVGVFTTEVTPADAVPLVYLEGGPGGAALDGAALGWSTIWAPLADEMPVVIFDQRGTGQSEPGLQCSEVDEVNAELLDELDEEVAEAAFDEAFEGCFDRLRSDGVDPALFNSVQSANDIEALRLALEEDAWNVLGVSYGTRLGQTLLRLHPDGVRAIVLDAVYPTSVTGAGIPDTAARAFGELWDACEADAACAETYPDLEARFWALVEELDENPLSFEALNPLSAESFPAVITGEGLAGAVFGALYSPSLLADLPFLIEQLENGETSGISTLTGLDLAQADFVAGGLFWSVQCHEEIALTTSQDYEEGRTGDPRFDDIFASGQAGQEDSDDICAVVDSGAADPVEDEPVVSDVPTLLLSGQFDPITPPAFGDIAAATLSTSEHVVLPHSGHGAVAEECGRAMIVEFLDSPGEPVDRSCLDDLEPPAFVPGPLDDLEFAEVTISVPLVGDVIAELPTTWTDQGEGFYASDASLLRQAGLTVLSAPPGSAELIVGSIRETLGGGEPEVFDPVEFGGRQWSWQSFEIPGQLIDIWASDDGFLVVMQAPEIARQDIIDGVIPTLLATVRQG